MGAELQQALTNVDMQHAWSKEVCEAVVRQIMQRYDTDADGSIDFDEWRNIMRETAQTHTPDSVAAADAPSERERELTLVRALSREHKPELAYALLREVS